MSSRRIGDAVGQGLRERVLQFEVDAVLGAVTRGAGEGVWNRGYILFSSLGIPADAKRGTHKGTATCCRFLP